ncbi:PEPxxWA-CTERM sorting domain-containing protein [Glacieibacterium frigidum]|uniref:PEP-CTERM sorting domain-containing protein n=1 Tax=Glacieibacterium frigidum TaxID=2593303 RepID=A0A552U907_9SPHN|nr:PEPxxWA-CTERM sorting domain-containing protein [Glacieibacterium frigidum]TRW14707.1 PEP-CTERM sorting domain-containing protein [Glacieibacterium frigidum]
MKRFLIAAAALAFTAPAAAVTFDAFASFNGTNGNGGFSYGGTDFTTLTAFSDGTGCMGLIANTICLNAPGNPALPGVFKSTNGAFQSGTVIVPADRLILHPGSSADLSNSVYIAFTAPTSGDFVFTSQFTSQDTNPSGVSIFAFVASGTSVIFTNLSGMLPGAAVNDTISASLLAGESFGYIISNNGSFNNDSTGVLASVSGPVPEPATWGLMIAGFAMVGYAARRRRVALTA